MVEQAVDVMMTSYHQKCSINRYVIATAARCWGAGKQIFDSMDAGDSIN